MRLILAFLLLLSFPLHLAAQDEEAQDVAYALPAVDEVHLESFQDFESLVAQGKWSRAFRAIGAQLEDPPEGFLAPNEEGFAFSWREGLWRALNALPPSGRRAFRLFQDAKARRDLMRAENLEGEEQEQALAAVFNTRFITKSGDDAASLLAEIAAARGDWSRVVDLISAILEHHPDTDLDGFELRARLARALAETGELKPLESLLADLEDRDPEGTIDFDEGAPSLATWAQGLRERVRRAPAGNSLVAVSSATFPTEEELQVEEVWKIKLKDLESNKRPNAWQPKLGSGVPDFRREGDRLFVNHAGKVRVIDIKTGHVDWKAGIAPSSLKAGHSGRCFVRRYDDRVLVTGPASSAFSGGLNNISTVVRLICRDAETGESLWNSRRIEGMREVSFLSAPVVRDGIAHFVTKRKGINAIALTALDMKDGKPVWEIPLGTPVDLKQNGMVWFGANQNEGLGRLRPRILDFNGELVVLSDGGAVLGVDPKARRLTWAFSYEMKPGNASSPAAALQLGHRLIFSTLGQKRVFEIDVPRRTVRNRPVCAGGALIGADADHVYVFGEELQAYRRSNLRRFRWAAYLKRGEYLRQPLITDRALWVYTRLGLVEIDRETGDSGRIVRAGLPRINDASLIEHEGILVAIAPQAIFAFRLVPLNRPSSAEAVTPKAPSTEKPPEKRASPEPDAVAPGREVEVEKSEVEAPIREAKKRAGSPPTPKTPTKKGGNS